MATYELKISPWESDSLLSFSQQTVGSVHQCPTRSLKTSVLRLKSYHRLLVGSKALSMSEPG